MAKADEIITQSEFAKRVGVSETAIRKAVKTGRIHKGFYRSNEGRPRIRYETALVEWHESASEQAPPAKLPPGQKTPRGIIEPGTDSDPAPPIQPGESINSLKQKHEKIKIASAAFDLKVKQGKYVEKEQVYKALFGAGQEVRQSLEAIPDRVIDEILAAKDRNTAHTLLTKAINAALERLAKLGKVLDRNEEDENKKPND